MDDYERWYFEPTSTWVLAIDTASTNGTMIEKQPTGGVEQTDGLMLSPADFMTAHWSERQAVAAA
ncbi:MAG: hypothetical protein JXR83_01335 [Deltaproteobacteria bacterium]|nr:hypothetical protein [Deltaproteobacteria bacterium]